MIGAIPAVLPYALVACIMTILPPIHAYTLEVVSSLQVSAQRFASMSLAYASYMPLPSHLIVIIVIVSGEEYTL